MSFKQILKKYRPLIIAVMIPLIIALLAALLFLMGYFVQWLWAQTISDIFEVKEISYWQAIGLILLCKILFGNTFEVNKSSSKKKRDMNNFEFSTGKPNNDIDINEEEEFTDEN